jgi:hypothetical protein
MSHGIHLEIQFTDDRSKIVKSVNTDRLVWLDYGVSIDVDTIKKLALEDFPDGYKVLIAPCVLDEIDWDLFKKKTITGSTEPANQRGLKFDTMISQPIKKNGTADFISSVSDGRVFAIECKSIQRKLRDANTHFKTFDQLKKLGVKIGVLCTSSVLCHYVYESIGNILESSGVRAGP